MVGNQYFKYDTNPLKNNLAGLERGMQTPYMFAYMNTIHSYFVNKSSDMFAEQKDPDGKAWSPLKRTTIRWRESLGFPGARPINVRTGKLKEFFTASSPDILGHSDGVISLAYPARRTPDKELRWRLEQASGLIRNGPARRVVGMNEADIAFILTYLKGQIIESLM